MAREDVNIKVSADVAEAIRMWRAMEEGLQGMARELENTGKRGKAAASGMEAEFGKLVGKWTAIGAGIALAKQSLDGLIAAQREYNSLTKEATVPTDALSRRFANQAGLSNAQASSARSAILNTAQNRGASPQAAFAVAEQLVSSGFSAEQATGGATDEVLKLLNATNAGGNETELTASLVKFLKATKQPLTSGSIQSNASSIFGLFQGTDLQTGVLGDFASKAANISKATGLKQELLPLLSQFLDFTSKEKAGTAFESSIAGLVGAKDQPAQVAALKSLGLTPDQVDFEGESFFTVQKRLAKAAGGVSPVDSSIAFKRLFGQQGLLAQQALFNDDAVRITQERLGINASGGAFERASAMTAGSLEAQARSADSRKASEFFDPDYIDAKTFKANMRAEMQRQGYGPYAQHAAESLFNFGNEGFFPLPGAYDPETIGFNVAEPFLGEKGARDLIDRSKGQTPQDVTVRVELTDQDAIAIPHKSDVSKLNQSK